MSIADFSAALQDAAFKQWFKNSTKSIFIQTTSELRPTEQTAQKTAFIIRPEEIASIATKLAGRAVTPQEIEKIRNNLINAVTKGRALERDDKAIFFPIIEFESGISKILEKGFADLPKVTHTDPKGVVREARISDFYEKGHVFSIASNVTAQTIRNLSTSKAPKAVKDRLIPILNEILAKLKQDDIESSNLGSIGYELYAKYDKNPYKYLVEMQPKEVNQASGTKSRTYTDGLRRYFNPQNYVELNKFFRLRAEKDSFIQKLITSKGSPSMVELIEEVISNSITGKTTKKKSYRVAPIKITTVSRKIDSTKVKKEIASTKSKVRTAINALTRAAEAAEQSFRLVEPVFNLEAILRFNINEQVKKNMGKGTESRILNYRSGRFSDSVGIERVTTSRDNFITVFYSYMKNPYATFSAGGRQQYPLTRDPKLLISKSIREIGASLAYNRMRAVNV